MENKQLAIMAVLAIIFLIGCGIGLYFAFKPKTDESPPSETTQPPGTTQPSRTTQPYGTTQPSRTTQPYGTTQPPGTTKSPYIAIDPIPPPQVSNYTELLKQLNELEPTPPTDNGEITLDNTSILEHIAPIVTNIENVAIQALFTTGLIYYDVDSKTYQLSPPNFKPPVYDGKPTTQHVVNVLNALATSVKNNQIMYHDIPVIQGLNVIPGITNNEIQQLLDDDKIQYSGNKFSIKL